ncbi:PCMD domain-containing protein [Winogradskyella sp. DF17]|uniref:PCMD domain-containing protein n=1 Tax=Winogradskyella pelagia TaxID=2819984 RepID=A0ABS3T0W0_9FLAO|nr:PCMD domain-containing protein [Winogradskyella sp. DF17]MBO3116377.1 PCMD domain-containing protein [Winogradskyella sp. DF17]
MTFKKHPFLVVLLVSLIGFNSCISDDEFGLSSFKEIKAFDLPGQAGVTTINSDERTVIIPMSEEANLSSITPSRIEISNLASISPTVNDVQDFSEPVIYTVTAEDNSTAQWTINAVAALPNPQLPNSSFDLWYNVSDYQQPGQDADNTVWGTANRALAIAGDANTNPEDLGGGDFAARLTSVEAPLLVRMAAATLFTGSFTEGFPNPVDPRSNINFGTPFNGRPSAFSLDYLYTPGPSYEDEDGNPLPGGDQCDIYVLLEKREGDAVERIGTGWFRSGTTVNNFSNLEVEIKYGELTPSDPEFEYANIRDDESWGNPQDTPTHITVVFSSSALGDFFTGAIGSELWVNNFELIYE